MLQASGAKMNEIRNRVQSQGNGCNGNQEEEPNIEIIYRAKLEHLKE